MIVPMQKITLLVSKKAINAALSLLRKLGVVHIEHMRVPQAEHITSLEHKLAFLDKALMIIGTGDSQKDDLDQGRILSYIKEIIELDGQKQKFASRLEEFQKERIWFNRWGNVSAATFGKLEKSGIFIRLYITDKRSLKSTSAREGIPQDRLVCLLHQDGDKIYLAHISTSQEEKLAFAEVFPPSENLQSLENKITTTTNNLEQINHELEKASSYANLFSDYKKDLLKKLEFCNVRFGMSEDENICCLEGFCPEESTGLIKKTADKEGWAVIARTPDDPQEAPTLIRNPKWVEIIKPVFRFMGTLPGYEEYDISFWFLAFFSLFFAMLIGDAGYGLLFLAATFFLHKKFKNIPKGPFFLMYLLSSATIIWGAITGTWFGLEQIAQLPLLNSLVVSRIDSFASSNQIFMIYLCFLIGAVHLSIAHIIVAFRYINSLICLAQIGWICIVWAAFFVAGGLVLSRPVPDFTLALGAVGFALVILFGNRQKNIFKGMALSLADLPLKTISSFSDVVSYLRLFAVGYASVAVATTFNNMALGEGINNIFAAFIAAVILFLGHSLNIVLGLMAVIVHGIRLNMLEFSGHLNMQWSGKEYRPFKE